MQTSAQKAEDEKKTDSEFKMDKRKVWLMIQPSSSFF